MGPEKKEPEQQLTRNGRKTESNRIISDEKNSYGRWKREKLENPPCCENCTILYSRWNDQTQNWILLNWLE